MLSAPIVLINSDTHTLDLQMSGRSGILKALAKGARKGEINDQDNLQTGHKKSKRLSRKILRHRARG
jgi:hypothetical protein